MASRPAGAVLILHSPRAVDGDTLAATGPDGRTAVYVRIWGVSAPERSEPLGDRARIVLEDMTRDQLVVCVPRGSSYARVVAACTVEGLDLGASLVTMGVARDCPAYSRSAYRQYETEASRALPLPDYCRE